MITAKQPPLKIKISGGFLLLLAVIWFFDRDNLLAALLPCVLVHELGHVAAMSLFDIRPTVISADITGFTIDSFGEPSFTGKLYIALAGPFFGLSFAFLCAQLGAAFSCGYFYKCAGIGLVLNCFNLLPVMPLDGGRAVRALFFRCLGREQGKTLCALLGYICALCVFLGGLALVLRGFGAALMAAGFWLLVLQIKTACKISAFGIK